MPTERLSMRKIRDVLRLKPDTLSGNLVAVKSRINIPKDLIPVRRENEKFGAGGRNRTGTGLEALRILSPLSVLIST
jgi:hypothetical protein